MMTYYVRVSPAQLDRLLKDPKSIHAFLHPDDEKTQDDGRQMDIEKTWDIIHFLLTGSREAVEGPLNDVVSGGEDIGDEDVGYGPARYLTPEKVAKAATALSQIPFEALWKRLDLKAMKAADVYLSESLADDEWHRGWVKQHYEALRKFFAQAAAAHEAIILYLG
jgi:hypothetical protein